AEVRMTQETLRKSRDRSRLLLKVNNSLVSRLELPELMKALASSLHEVMRQDFAGIALYDAETKQYHAHALQGFEPGNEIVPENTIIPLDGTVGGMAIKSRGPYYIPRPDPRLVAEVSRKLYARGFKTLCSVPLIAGERVIGCLTIGSKLEDALKSDDIELLEQVGHQVALAVDNAIAYREIERLKNKLTEEKLYLEDEIRTEFNFEEIIGDSPALKHILKQIEKVAPTDSTVLIQG